MSSIDNEFERANAEAPAEHTLADGSVGSDTETAKSLIADDAGRDTPETSHHVRSNSIKKPTSFKAVSVTKNFLAKAGTASTPNVKVNGDKGMKDPSVKYQQSNVLSYVYNDDNDSASSTSSTACRKVCKWPPSLGA